MHGRSDGVLNPSGIRFGSGEVSHVKSAILSVEADDPNRYMLSSKLRHSPSVFHKHFALAVDDHKIPMRAFSCSSL